MAVLGFNLRYFGWFLASPFVAGIAVLGAIGVGLVDALGRSSRWWQLVLAGLLLLFSPLAGLGGIALHDRIVFLLWAPFHRAQIDAAIGRDGIVAYWDGYGMAGLENDAYLVVDVKDGMLTPQGRADWGARMQQSCFIGGAERMRPTLYIVTLADCAFDWKPAIPARAE